MDVFAMLPGIEGQITDVEFHRTILSLIRFLSICVEHDSFGPDFRAGNIAFP